MHGVAVVLVIVWLHYCGGMCAMHVMNDDDAGGFMFGWQNVLCSGDGVGTHLLQTVSAVFGGTQQPSQQ